MGIFVVLEAYMGWGGGQNRQTVPSAMCVRIAEEFIKRLKRSENKKNW